VNWEEKAKEYRDKIMKFLEDNYLPDLQENIIAEHYVDPRYFKNTLNSHLGSAFSVEPILTQSAWFRPHNSLKILIIYILWEPEPIREREYPGFYLRQR